MPCKREHIPDIDRIERRLDKDTMKSWADRMSAKLKSTFGFRQRERGFRPRNVLLIVIDALRHDGFSCFGNARKTSPNIDSLARKGVIFENAISASGSTPGAMGAIMTSRYPLFVTDIFNKDQTKVMDFGFSRFYSEEDKPGHFPGGLPSLPSILREQGYKTLGFSANPIMSSELNMTQGFELYDEFPGGENWNPFPNAETVSSRVADYFLKQGDSPSFVYAHYMDTHHPYSSPHPFLNHYKKDFIRGNDNGDIDWKWFHSKDPAYLQKISRHARAMYDSQIRFFDYQLGKLFAVLRKKGILEDTLIVILADHGDEFLEHGGTVHHPKLYDELTRIPLVLHCPQAFQPKRISRMVRSVDILPTILDVLGIESNIEFDGCSLVSLFTGDDDTLPDLAFMDMPPFRGIRTERWKLIRNTTTGQAELYDLLADPGESKNVVEEFPQVTSAMLARLDGFVSKIAENAEISKTASSEGSEVSSEIAKRLKGLGYL